jgi:glycerol-3-phosphate cytidylyltransferase
LKPDIHAKGGDYKTPDALPETEVVRAYGGDVVILQLVDGKSTTNIVKKMQEHKP